MALAFWKSYKVQFWVLAFELLVYFSKRKENIYTKLSTSPPCRDTWLSSTNNRMIFFRVEICWFLRYFTKIRHFKKRKSVSEKDQCRSSESRNCWRCTKCNMPMLCWSSTRLGLLDFLGGWRGHVFLCLLCIKDNNV